MGQLQEPVAARRSAREGPPLVTEQLGLQQRVREGSAVDGQEGQVPAGAGRVHGTGGQLFPAPALAEDEHVRAGLAGALEEIPQAIHGTTLALHDRL